MGEAGTTNEILSGAAADIEQLREEKAQLQAEFNKLSARYDFVRSAIGVARWDLLERLRDAEEQLARFKSMDVGLFTNPEALAVHQEKVGEAMRLVDGLAVQTLKAIEWHVCKYFEQVRRVGVPK